MRTTATQEVPFLSTKQVCVIVRVVVCYSTVSNGWNTAMYSSERPLALNLQNYGIACPFDRENRTVNSGDVTRMPYRW